ncbi:MAG: riboflavin synthase [Bacteroidota bacterium]
MFTGIIEEVGHLVDVVPFGGGRKLIIRASFADQLKPDESVAVNGACQTVVAADASTFEVVAIEETLRKTTFGSFAAGMPVNLERAMPMNGRLDGHFVLGHVDATGTVVSVEQEETNWLMRVSFAPEYEAYIIPVGSVTIDGISLTVARLEGNELTVAIIPHTYTHTNVSTWKPGDAVNLEFDMIGKYVVRWLDKSKVAG